MPQITTKDLIKKDISVGLGGYVAEKLIFGEELLSAGSCKDIEMVTQRAIAYVKTYGMTGFPILVGLESDKMNDSHHFDHESSDREVKKLVDGCLKTTERIIKKNKTLLLKLSEYLSENSIMDKNLIATFVEKYAINPTEIKNSDTYYGFKNILQEQLKKIK